MKPPEEMAPVVPPPAVSLREGERFPLDRPDGVWQVERGRVEWFKFDARAGSPYGQHIRLGAVTEGEVVVGALPGIHFEYRFEVVAAEPTRLSFVPFAALAADADAMRAIERWIGRLGTLLAAPPTPPVAVTAAPGGPQTLVGGEALRLEAGSVSWLEVCAGGLAALGERSVTLTPAAGPVPVGGEIWFAADGETTVRAHAQCPVERDAVGASLSGLLNLALRRFERLEDAAAGREVGRMERVQTHLRHLEASSARIIAREVESSAPIELGGEPLLAALDAIGREAAITFVRPKECDGLVSEGLLTAVAQASGVRYRRLRLRERWWDDDLGPLLAFRRDAAAAGATIPVALLRGRLGGAGYRILIPGTAPRPLTAADRDALGEEAIMLFRPFPARIDGLLALGRFAFSTITGEIALMAAFSIVVSLLGLLSPIALRAIVDAAIPDGDRQLLWELAACLAGATFGATCFSLAQSLVTLRGNVRLTLQLQAALIDRLLNLPASFFRNFSSGDLLQRAMVVNQIAGRIGASGIKALFAGLAAVLNVGLLCYWSWQLALIPIAIAVLAAGVTFAVGVRVRREALEQAKRSGKLFGFLVQVVGGVSKFRVAGAEGFAFEQWARRYAVQLGSSARSMRASNLGRLCSAGYTTAGTILVYYAVMKLMGFGLEGSALPPLSMGEFLAFNAAFGAFLGGVSTLTLAGVDIMDAFAQRALCQPILDAAPEANEAKADPGRLRGEVELKDVTFRYHRDGPYVLRGVSLRAQPGELIAIVGPSGCGKSTLFRLALGFEHPEAGAIFFDQQELSGLNAHKVRRQIGTVLQTATIGPGSIFDCVANGAVLTADEVWAALRDAGLEADVRAMPMRLDTPVNEGGHNFSGGQRQRLMIARALAQNTKILLFDEATSALDNHVQQLVSDALNRRQVTRIVIAHRLSTIERADRIYVLERGRIVQQGTYAELAAAPGLFQTMMRRQTL